MDSGERTFQKKEGATNAALKQKGKKGKQGTQENVATDQQKGGGVFLGMPAVGSPH